MAMRRRKSAGPIETEQEQKQTFDSGTRDDTFDFVGYDWEALGLRVATDQPVQGGFIKLDRNLEVVDSLDVTMCLNDYAVPGPRALEVTGLSPSDLDTSDRIAEYLGAQRVSDILSDDRKEGKRLYFGYNTMSYDEELTRYFLFRNLQRPYKTSGKFSRRLDLYPSFQYLHFIRPGLIHPKIKDDGGVSWRLGDVVEANGITKMKAHDGFEDTVMTKDLMIKFLREAEDVFWQCVEMSNKHAIGQTLQDASTGSEFVMHFTHFGMPDVRPLAPMARVGHKGHKVVCVDLAVSPREWVDMSVDDILANLYSPESPFKVIKPNACPQIINRHDPSLKAALDREEYRNDYGTFEARASYIRDRRIVQKLEQVTSRMEEETRKKFSGRKVTTEYELYGSFPGRADENHAKMFLRTEDWQERVKIANQIKDHRLRDFAHRLIAMHGPDEVQTVESLQALRNQIELRLSSEENVVRDVLTIDGARSELGELEDESLRDACRQMLDDRQLEFETRVANLTAWEESIMKAGEPSYGDDDGVQMSLFR